MAILVREVGKQNGHISESLDVPLWTVILSLLRRFSFSTVHRFCPASSGLFMPSLLHASYSLLTGLQILLLAPILTSPTLTSFTPNLWFPLLPDILSKVCQGHLQFNKSKNNLDNLSSSSTNFRFLDSFFLYGNTHQSVQIKNPAIILDPSTSFLTHIQSVTGFCRLIYLISSISPLF